MNNRERNTVFLDFEATRKFIDKIDNQLFKIKGWALFTASGVIAYGVSQKNPLILFVNSIVVIAFCFLETAYKTFHETGLIRMQFLEKIISHDINPSYKLPRSYQFGMGSAIQPPTLKAMLGILIHPGRRHLIGYYFMIVLGSILAGIYINCIK